MSIYSRKLDYGVLLQTQTAKNMLYST